MNRLKEIKKDDRERRQNTTGRGRMMVMSGGMAQTVKCMDCELLKACFIGFAYCMGDLNVERPEEIRFECFECKETVEIVDPTIERECEYFEEVEKE